MIRPEPSAARTGKRDNAIVRGANTSDGKVFVTPAESAIRIRTGDTDD